MGFEDDVGLVVDEVFVAAGIEPQLPVAQGLAQPISQRQGTEHTAQTVCLARRLLSLGRIAGVQGGLRGAEASGVETLDGFQLRQAGQFLQQVIGVIADAGQRRDQRLGVEQDLHEVAETCARQ